MAKTATDPTGFVNFDHHAAWMRIEDMLIPLIASDRLFLSTSPHGYLAEP